MSFKFHGLTSGFDEHPVNVWLDHKGGHLEFSMQ